MISSIRSVPQPAKKKYWYIIIPSFCTLFLFLLSFLLIFKPLVREGFISRKKEMLTNVIDISISEIRQYKNLADRGEMSEEDAKREALSSIENFRYGENNEEYFFILDFAGNLLMHPFTKDLVDSSVLRYKDPNGIELFQEMENVVAKSQKGFVEYFWQEHEDSSTISPKISYVESFEPWGWIIGSGMYLNDVEQELSALRNKLYLSFLFIAVIVLIVCFVIIRQGVALQHKRYVAEKENYENILFLKKLVNNIPSLIYIKNMQCEYMMANKSFFVFTGEDIKTDISGKKDADFFTGSTIDILNSNDRKVLDSGEILRCEERVACQGSNKIFLSFKFPLKDSFGMVVGLCGVMTDITDLIELQEELKDLNENLEIKISERTVELDEANTSLKYSLEQLKSAQAQLVEQEKMASLGGLVAGVAHEINTPVGIGVTAVSHLQEKNDYYKNRYNSNELTQDDFEDYMNLSAESCEMIFRNLLRASDLIKSFKQIAVDQTNEEIRLFNLKEYIEEIIRSLKPKFKRTGHVVNIRGDDKLMINSCPGGLSQVLTNLIMNSFIHGFEKITDGVIDIVISENADEVVLHYYDNGVGVSDEVRKKIFEPFFTTKRGQGGSGLGMNIVYNIVTQKLNGSIVCENESGSGVHFIITLPRDNTKNNSG